MAIQLFVPKYNTNLVLSQIKECLDIGWTGMGYKTLEFENKWKNYTGHNNCYFINSATAGLYLAVDILKTSLLWNDGDEVLTTGLTFVSTNHAILKSNLVPAFCDVDESLTLDPKEIIKKITPRTRAVIFVGLGGNPGNLGEIKFICTNHNLKLIVDAAHMSGSRSNSSDPTLGADAIVYSFQSVKNLPTADSGMLCFKDSKYDEIARKKGWLGINKDTYERFNNGTYNWKYSVDYVGDKYHGNSIMAAIAIAQLETLDNDNARRNEIAVLYSKLLATNPKIKLIHVKQEDFSSRHLFQVIVDDRDKLMIFLNENQIFPGVHYINNMEYKPYRSFKSSCPNTEYYSNRILSLPLHLNMSDDDVKIVANCINGFYDKNKL